MGFIKDWLLDLFSGGNEDEETKEKIVEINRKYGTQKGAFTRMINSLNQQREQVYNCNLKQFVELFNQIHSSELVDNPKLKIEVNPRISRIEIDEYGDSYYLKDNKIVNVSDIDIEIKRREFAVLNLKSANKFLKSVKETIATLDKLMGKANERLENLINSKGTDYSNYTEDEKEFLRSAVNLANAITYFISESYITPKGNLRAPYKRFVAKIAKSDDAIMKQFAKNTLQEL